MGNLSKGERMVLWGGVALLVCSFIPMWMSVDAEAFGVSVSENGNAFQGYGFFPVELGLLCAFAATGIAIAHAAGVAWRNAQVSLGLCAAALVLLVIGIIMGPEGAGVEIAGAGFDVSRGFMLFVGTALAAVMAWGAWQDQQAAPAAAPMTPSAPMPPAP